METQTHSITPRTVLKYSQEKTVGRDRTESVPVIEIRSDNFFFWGGGVHARTACLDLRTKVYFYLVDMFAFLMPLIDQLHILHQTSIGTLFIF